MVNINLVTQESPQGRNVSWGKALPVSLFILILTIISYIGMIFYEKKLDKDIARVKEYHKEKLDGLKGGNVKNVIDFQNRLDSANKLLSMDTNTASVFLSLEKTVLPQVRVSSLELSGDSSSVDLVCVTDNFNSVAKQIWSFKKSEDYKDVIAGETKVLQGEGKISFDVTLRLKSKNE